MNVGELREALKARGLGTSGLKATLKARLLETVMEGAVEATVQDTAQALFTSFEVRLAPPLEQQTRTQSTPKTESKTAIPPATPSEPMLSWYECHKPTPADVAGVLVPAAASGRLVSNNRRVPT